MNPAAPKQKGVASIESTDITSVYKRVRAVKRHGYSAIDGRTYGGLEAKRWRDSAVQQKGGTSCPFHIKLEIDGDMLDVWLMLELAEVIAIEPSNGATVLNRRSKSLSKLHEQYQTIAARFARRCESLHSTRAAWTWHAGSCWRTEDKMPCVRSCGRPDITLQDRCRTEVDPIPGERKTVLTAELRGN
jgi:hypothetical protein